MLVPSGEGFFSREGKSQSSGFEGIVKEFLYSWPSLYFWLVEVDFKRSRKGEVGCVSAS